MEFKRVITQKKVAERFEGSGVQVEVNKISAHRFYSDEKLHDTKKITLTGTIGEFFNVLEPTLYKFSSPMPFPLSSLGDELKVELIANQDWWYGELIFVFDVSVEYQKMHFRKRMIGDYMSEVEEICSFIDIVVIEAIISDEAANFFLVGKYSHTDCY